MRKFLLLLSFLIIRSQFIEGQDLGSNHLSQKSKQPNKSLRLTKPNVRNDLFSINSFLIENEVLPKHHELRPIRSREEDEFGIVTEQLQQYYKGVKVENSYYNITSKNGVVWRMRGQKVDFENFELDTPISEQDALNKVLNYLNATEYVWQNEYFEDEIKHIKNDPDATYFPVGELVIANMNGTGKNYEPVLAFRFEVFSIEPMLFMLRQIPVI